MFCKRVPLDAKSAVCPPGPLSKRHWVKAQLPVSAKNEDIAINVAAMANDGGVLLYGVAEDHLKRPTPSPDVLSPLATPQGARVGCLGPAGP